MTNDPFLQFFLIRFRNPTMSSTLPSLIVLGTQRIPAVSVSKSRPELQKSPKFGGTKLQLENRGVFQCFPSRNLSRTSVAPAVAAGVSAFDLTTGAPVGGGKVPQLKRPIWKHCGPRFLQTLFFGVLYRCLQ